MATLKSILTDVAEAIRSKKETTEKIKPVNFANEILSIKTGGAVASGDEITAQASENINAGNSVVIKDTGALPSYLPKYYIPTSVQIGETVETPTVQGHTVAINSFNQTSQTVLISEKIISVRYTSGNIIIFIKQNDEFVQAKIDNEYKYLTGSNLLVDFDSKNNKLYVLDYNTNDISFNLKIYNLEYNNFVCIHTETLNLGITSVIALTNLSMFISQNHIFIVASGSGMYIFKYENNSLSQLTSYISTAVIRLQDYVQKSDTELYISLGTKGLILKYELVNGSYTQTSKSAGNLSMNIDTATLNRDVSATILGSGTTRKYYNITESGSTISLTAGTMPTNLTGDTFCFMKDSNDILRFGSSSIAGNTAIYRLKDGAATLVTTPGTDFVPSVTTGSYGAYIFGRQASTVSSHVLCQLSSGGLCIFVPSYETAPFSITKANNKLSTESDVYALGFSLEDITAGNNGQVIASFIK